MYHVHIYIAKYYLKIKLIEFCSWSFNDARQLKYAARANKEAFSFISTRTH